MKRFLTLCLCCIVWITSAPVMPAKAQAVTQKSSELKGVWISYLEFSNGGVEKMTKSQFKTYINKVFDQCKAMKLNTVFVQIRPSGDAFYPSKYFPWSNYCSGKQGKSPGYDPTAYMVSAAHKRGLAFYAWLNPYRVSAVSSDINKLSPDNQARKWRKSKDASVRRNVLTYDNKLYFNPSKAAVRKLIVNGVKEVVKKYKVDGIVFDDYFYPNLGSNYQKKFDYIEYSQYQKNCKKQKKTAKSIVQWRREQVNMLLKNVKTAAKSINKKVRFGVSPEGNIRNLISNHSHYCDVKNWMKTNTYMDFICPQLYWSKTNPVSPYNGVLEQWIKLKKTKNIKLYVALAAYKAGCTKKEAKSLSPSDLRWNTSSTNLKEQVLMGRKSGQVSGYVFYRYDNLVSSKAKKERYHLMTVL